MKKYFIWLAVLCFVISSYMGYGYWFGPAEGTSTNTDNSGTATTTTIQPYKTTALLLWLGFGAAGWWLWRKRAK